MEQASIELIEEIIKVVETARGSDVIMGRSGRRNHHRV
jgi:hypothetical protein